MPSVSLWLRLATRTSFVFCLIGGTLTWVMPTQALEVNSENLTLDQALTLAKNNYGLSANQVQIEIQQALADQAKRGPNPNLNLSVEEFPSLNQKSGEFSLNWQQTFPVSGRLTRQSLLAEKETELAILTLNLQKAMLRRDLTQAFYRALTWQVYLQELKRLQNNAQKSKVLVEAQNQVGKVLLTEVNRARLLEEDLRLQIQTANTQWQQARAQLALFWNQNGDDIPPLAGALIISITEDTSKKAEQSLLNKHPEWVQAEQRITKQELNLNLQRALAVPDLTGSLGLRYLPYQDNIGSLLNLSWPIPLANANQGNQIAVEQQIKQAQLNQRETQIQLKNLMHQSQLAYQNSQALIRRYQQQVLPMAEQNLELNQIAYDAGKLPYLAVLDTQRSLMTFKLDYIKTWGEYWRAKAQLEYFTIADE